MNEYFEKFFLQGLNRMTDPISKIIDELNFEFDGKGKKVNFSIFGDEAKNMGEILS